MPDGDVDACMLCTTAKFSLIVRKHHCRFCGQVVCDACSKRKAFYAATGSSERCCDPCFEDHPEDGTVAIAIHITNNNGDTPLMHAAAQGHATVVQTLAEAGASVDRRNGHGQSPLDTAAALGCEATVRVR